mmetsp:Transcript_44744/g.130262  ORF Transcript_44744/g.130262 Transcript_44744/m.130262 type:complete len:293 (+) Transcript_44744:2103-2981(+)
MVWSTSPCMVSLSDPKCSISVDNTVSSSPLVSSNVCSVTAFIFAKILRISVTDWRCLNCRCCSSSFFFLSSSIFLMASSRFRLISSARFSMASCFALFMSSSIFFFSSSIFFFLSSNCAFISSCFRRLSSRRFFSFSTRVSANSTAFSTSALMVACMEPVCSMFASTAASNSVLILSMVSGKAIFIFWRTLRMFSAAFALACSSCFFFSSSALSLSASCCFWRAIAGSGRWMAPGAPGRPARTGLGGGIGGPPAAPGRVFHRGVMVRVWSMGPWYKIFQPVVGGDNETLSGW